MSKHALFGIVICLCSSGCYDFLDPDFPEAGAPAFLQANAYIDESGSAELSALLVPGLTAAGFQRRVSRDTLEIYGLKLAPTGVRANGSREYMFRGKLPGFSLSKPFELRAPVVEDVAGQPPPLAWFGVRKADPDTVAWRRGSDLILHVDTVPNVSQPAPEIRQWFLELHATKGRFSLSSDGAPPATLRVPPDFIPVGDSLSARLTYYQSGTLQSAARDYIANVVFNTQLLWIVRVLP